MRYHASHNDPDTPIDKVRVRLERIHPMMMPWLCFVIVWTLIALCIVFTHSWEDAQVNLFILAVSIGVGVIGYTVVYFSIRN